MFIVLVEVIKIEGNLMPNKVPFQVVYSSSADDNHREKELEVR